MSFNPYQTSAAARAEMLERDEDERRSQNRALIYDIISTPNGQSYGVNGHIPCDHSVKFTYASGIKTFDGHNWS